MSKNSSLKAAPVKKNPRCAGSGRILSGNAVLDLEVVCPVCGRLCRPRHRWEIPGPSAQIPSHLPKPR